MPTIPGPESPAASTAPVGDTVHLLRRWEVDIETVSPYRDYAAALAALAARVRADWSAITHRAEVPDSHAGLGDAEVVLALYGGNGGSGGTGAPTFGVDESSDAGFEITEAVVTGPGPREVSLRRGTLRVLDSDPTDTDVAAVTYCLDAEGLTVAVFPGPDSHPVVLITPEGRLSGIPVTVRLEDPFQPGGFEQTYQVS